ncbi:hypothetical protein FQN57_001385 [Myotisia sp. PD_48]|nr:hypothetical protein FQN57_001385 [Myotisia sp. PD_48]
MKLATYLLAAASVANAHYIFPRIIHDGTTSADWEYVRRTANKWTSEGVNNVNSGALRCLEENGRPLAKTKAVKAGDKIGFTVASYPIMHIGPLFWYMAKVPSGQKAETWNPAGNVWFKIDQVGPVKSSSGWTWPPNGASELHVNLPKSLPDGDYILRVEHLALHDASYPGGAQFYLACAQINVTGGGNGTPGPLVSIPGLYKSNDKGILIDLNGKPPAEYIFPGPPVWQG